MKKSLFPAFVLLVLLCGCKGPTVMVNGVEYEALSEEEVKELCSMSEMYLRNNVPNVISEQESRTIRSFDPECTIKYNGDRSGRAVIRWSLPKRNIEVVFDGLLLDPSAKCWVQSEEKQPEVLDFTKKSTLREQQKAVEPGKRKRAPRRNRRRARQ